MVFLSRTFSQFLRFSIPSNRARTVCFFSKEAAGIGSSAGGTRPQTSSSESHHNEKTLGWISGLFKGVPGQTEKQSHSSLLSVGDVIYEIQTHDVIGGHKERYLDVYKKFVDELRFNVPGADLFGSWTVAFGNQNQVVSLLRYENGYSDLDSYLMTIKTNSKFQKLELECSALCTRRRTAVIKPFSYWGEPKERGPSHVYDLRCYTLKPGSMIEWGNIWSKGITYRREYNQAVGGFFAHVGQLYMVFHIWAYEGMVGRQQIRQNTWAKPGWDETVAYTVPLIQKMQSSILIPTEYSKLK